MTASVVAISVASAVATARVSHHHVFRTGIAYLYDRPFEFESLTGHRVVEVHRNALIAYGFNCSDHTVSLVIAHGKLISDFEHAVLDFAVDHEYLFRKIDNGFGHNFAVRFSCFEPECERVARLEPGKVCFECGKQKAASEYELERTFGRYGFDDRSVDFQLIAKTYKFFFFDFHVIVLLSKMYFYLSESELGHTQQKWRSPYPLSIRLTYGKNLFSAIHFTGNAAV